MKEILVFRLSMRSVMVVIIITQWTSRHRGDPFSSLRRPPLLSIQIWQSDKCKRTLPSPTFYSLSRIRPTTPGILAKKKKKIGAIFIGAAGIEISQLADYKSFSILSK